MESWQLAIPPGRKWWHSWELAHGCGRLYWQRLGVGPSWTQHQTRVAWRSAMRSVRILRASSKLQLPRRPRKRLRRPRTQRPQLTRWVSPWRMLQAPGPRHHHQLKHHHQWTMLARPASQLISSGPGCTSCAVQPSVLLSWPRLPAPMSPHTGGWS